MEKDNKLNQEKIIQKCINESYETTEKPSPYFGWSNTLFNFKDSLKFNYLPTNSKFIPCKSFSTVHIFYKEYNMNEEKTMTYLNNELKKIIYISYRNNYKPQINIKNNTEYTSDCGWGCMIRSSQMLFAKILFEIFKYKYEINNEKEKETLLKYIIPFFMDNNLNITGEYYMYMENYLTKLINFSQAKNLGIITIDPPFSIHKICILGEIYNRTCGEWFSDFELPKIYNIINENFNIIPYLNIIHFITEIELYKVIENCFLPNDKKEKKNKGDILYYEDEKEYIFNKMGVIFVSLRLGVNDVSSDYFPSIKKLFDCLQFVGFIGGKVNAASYFIGFVDDYLLFLDPHYNQTSITELNNESFNTYLQKDIYKLPFSSLQTALTVGFLFRNINEFRQLYAFLKKFNENEFPCFYTRFLKNNNNGSVKRGNSYINKCDEDDDF